VDGSLDGLDSLPGDALIEIVRLFGLDQRIVLALLLNLQRIDSAKRDCPFWSRATDRIGSLCT
jgi:hypothetical protein